MRISENAVQVLARKRYCRALSRHGVKYGGNKVLGGGFKVARLQGFKVMTALLLVI
jgi:hypothetical protein